MYHGARQQSGKRISGTFITQDDRSIPLDMVDSSVDDMYSTCATKMEAKVKGTYFKKEMRDVFKNVWISSEKCAKKKIKERERGDGALTKDHLQAICAYTAGGPENLYKTFNDAVRTNRAQYSSTFPFHSLHFWLTRAIQVLKTRDGKCRTTFRRTKSQFTGVVSKVIRFGTFTSTSNLPTLTSFGTTTCFEIRTCHGAYLKKYPKLGDKEQEVLIPPYETFKIISKDKPIQQLSDCKTVYILNSTGVQSNLDCQLIE
ncbi:erythroblast NAD(P)(+)--arginine ADP-ribosyltransferase-like isoform X2 [Poeciliopsis prolifica]|uniref:erythroblast NAD(P)(+)--arginine ADP-ribosyltransferase-like isoform X2 n=1 Tax=Poeciliopsis prolifica TaxID=188132 RepID=UPI0024139CE4|nr:erythroblast NAD(P)(+)--arginine ADP-ribosyltransferase-like isoform X2 [Poeciliopsis prolifica]